MNNFEAGNPRSKLTYTPNSVYKLQRARRLMPAIEVRQKNEVSGAKRHSWGGGFETVAALILGLATLGSAWSAYQSWLWAVSKLSRCRCTRRRQTSGRKAIYANEFRKVDAVLFERYLSALSEKDQRMANFLFDRFGPSLRWRPKLGSLPIH